MRRFILALALFVPAVLSAQQLGTVPQSTLDCIKVLLAQEKAWNNGDMDGFMKGYKNSPDIVFIGKNVQKGYDPVADNYKKSYSNRAQMGVLSFSDFDVKSLDDNFSVVIGKYHLERKKQDGGNAEGIFSLVMEKTDEGWKIVVDHTTS